MRLDESRFPDLLRRAREFRVILLHGEQDEVVRSRARAVLDVLHDPGADMFGAVELDVAAHRRIAEELAAPTLGAGSVVIRVRDATDIVTASLETVLRRPGTGVVVLEAAALPTKSSLRRLVEQSAASVSMLCRGSARETQTAIRASLADLGVSIEPDAMVTLEQHPDRADAVRTVISAGLLVGPGGSITHGELRALDGGAAADVEAAVDAVLGGDMAGIELLTILLADGVTPTSLLRGMLVQIGRLRSVRLKVDGGLEPAAALASARPPLFGGRAVSFRNLVGLWTVGRLNRAASIVWNADRDCRRTGYPVLALCQSAFREVALTAKD